MAQTNESERLLAILRDPNASETERQDAFERILDVRDDGWWGTGKLLQFAQAYALYRTRKALQPAGLSPDQVDWEGVADEALVVLYYSAPRIESSPAGWFRGVLKNLVAREIEKQFPFLTAEALDDEMPRTAAAADPEPPPVDEGAAPDVAPDDNASRVRTAIAALAPTLRRTAELLLIERCTREQIRDIQGISSELLRQRIKRITKSISRREPVESDPPSDRKPPRVA